MKTTKHPREFCKDNTITILKKWMQDKEPPTIQPAAIREKILEDLKEKEYNNVQF